MDAKVDVAFSARRSSSIPLKLAFHPCPRRRLIPSKRFASIRVHSRFKFMNDLLLKNEVFQIVGAAIEVLNGLGHGLHEKPYENALVVEFGLRTIPSHQQLRF